MRATDAGAAQMLFVDAAISSRNSRSRSHVHITHRTSPKAELFCEIRMMCQAAVVIARSAMDAYDSWIFPKLMTQPEGECAKHKFVRSPFFLTGVPPSICVMCKSGQATTSITRTDAELATTMCQDPTRRALILTALAAGTCLGVIEVFHRRGRFAGQQRAASEGRRAGFLRRGTRRRGDQAARI